MVELKPHQIPGHRFYVDKATAPVHWHKLPFHKQAISHLTHKPYLPFLMGGIVATLVVGTIIPAMSLTKEDKEASVYGQMRARTYQFPEDH